MPELTAEQRSDVRVCMRVNNEYSNDLRVRREAEALAAAGFDVVVVADARPDLPAEETSAGVRVKRIGRTSRIPYKSIVDPLLAERADIYHAHDIDSLFPSLAAARLARRHARVVYDSHELWSAHAPDKLHSRRRTLVRFEGPMVRACDALISASDGYLKVITQKYGFTGPATTILNVPRTFTHAELQSHWARRDADPEFKIAYVSVFQHGRGAVPLIRSLAHLPDSHVVELIGPFPQPDYEELVRAAAEPYPDRVRFAGRIPPEEIVPRLAEATVSAVIIEPISESYRLTTPNKLFDSFAAGTPVVASDLPMIGGITRQTDAGVTCDPGDPADIARAVGEIANRLPELRENARSAAERYNWDAEKAKLVALYDELCTRR